MQHFRRAFLGVVGMAVAAMLTLSAADVNAANKRAVGPQDDAASKVEVAVEAKAEDAKAEDAKPEAKVVIVEEAKPSASVVVEAPSASPALCATCKPCILYRHVNTFRRICCDGGCNPPMRTKMLVQDPCNCNCVFEIDVCLPGCCTDAPSISNCRDLLGRTTVVYRWCCGYEVHVCFRVRGDVVVTSIGRI